MSLSDVLKNWGIKSTKTPKEKIKEISEDYSGKVQSGDTNPDETIILEIMDFIKNSENPNETAKTMLEAVINSKKLPYFNITILVFDKVTIHTDKKFYPHDIVIEKRKLRTDDQYIKRIEFGRNTFSSYRITHKQLVNSGKLAVHTNSRESHKENPFY